MVEAAVAENNIVKIAEPEAKQKEEAISPEELKELGL